MARTVEDASYRKARRRRRAGALLTLALAAACHTTPVTGRRSLNAFATSDDVRLGREAYDQVLAEAELVTSGPEFEMVQRVMARLAAIADDPGFEWEARVVRDDATVNAFALPGGKMAVYTGILPVCGGETGLAVVMGHEIGHVVARHGTEQLTNALGVDAVLAAVDLGNYAGLAQTGLELFVNRPFGRNQESEADAIGLIYMARAGYDPREAVAFWGRMESQGGGGGPEFLSTHPSHETRIERLTERLPEALEIWRSTGGGGSPPRRSRIP